MSAKWTPGPWEVAKKGTYPDDEGCKVLGPDGYPRYYVAQFIKDADVDLISAAPDLYDALERIIRYHGASISFDCTRAADRALAKARGKVRS